MSAARLSRGPRQGKAKSAPEFDPERLRLALQRSARGIAKLIAAELEVPVGRVYDMTEGRKPSYHLMVARWQSRLLKELPRERALAPLYALIDAFLTSTERGEIASGMGAVKSLADLMGRAAALVARGADMVRDGEIDDLERPKLEELIEAVSRACHLVRREFEALTAEKKPALRSAG